MLGTWASVFISLFMNQAKVSLPKKGTARADLLKRMQALSANDADFSNGKIWSMVYYAGREMDQFLQKALSLYYLSSTREARAYPSLARFESEIISMSAHLLGGDENVRGNVTSGGTESILMTALAPSYPQGVVDPIGPLSEIARVRGIPFHMDACAGGFMLPFVRQLGFDVPDFDFSLPGVTSISADIHKYGFASRGVSLVLYRDQTLHDKQSFSFSDWPGEPYHSPTMTGVRMGGPIAAAWAVMHLLGQTGYLELARRVMRTAKT